MAVISISTLGSFNEELAKATGLVIVDFYATWCGPCRAISPAIARLSTQGEYGTVLFLKVDVDEASEISEKYEISGMPTFLYFKNGQKVDEVVGANENKVIEKLQRHM